MLAAYLTRLQDRPARQAEMIWGALGLGNFGGLRGLGFRDFLGFKGFRVWGLWVFRIWGYRASRAYHVGFRAYPKPYPKPQPSRP